MEAFNICATLLKLPVPVPLELNGSAVITGEPAVFQVMPLCVTGLPPSSLTLPPLAAEIAVIAEALVVVTVGSIAASVVKVRSAP